MFPVGVLAFKCMKGLAPSYLSDRFVPRSTVHDRNMRNKNCLNIPPYQSAAGQRTFLQRAITQQILKLITTCDHCCRQPAYFQNCQLGEMPIDAFIYYYNFDV